jgi:hypothetical protein
VAASVDQRLRAGACIVQRIHQPRQCRGRAVAGLFHALGFAPETGGQLRGARRRIGHDQFELAVGLVGEAGEFLRLATQRVDCLLHRRAFGAERAFEGGAFFLQFFQQIAERGAVTLVAAEQEFGARHRRVRHRLDALGLAVEFQCNGMRRLGRRFRGSAETGGLGVERDAGRLERALGGFDGGFQLRGAAGDDFAGARGHIGQRARDGFDALAFLRQPRGDRFGAHIGARARFVERRDVVFENGFERAQAREGAVEARIQSIELAAHGAAETRGGTRGGLISAEQFVGQLGQRFGRHAHLRPAREGPGRDHHQHRRHQGREGEQCDLLDIEMRKSVRSQIAPQIGRGSPHPEGAQG